MKKDSGKSRVTVLILIILVIGAIYAINYAKKMAEETKVQDLRTNMLLMQAEVKKGLEEVCFRTVNLDESKEEDLTKINEIKDEYLEGIILKEAKAEVQEAVKNIPEFNFDENCYYLDESILTKIGIKNVEEEINGYFIVKYDFSNITVEVVNTKGHEGNYTLTDINKDIDG